MLFQNQAFTTIFMFPLFSEHSWISFSNRETSEFGGQRLEKLGHASGQVFKTSDMPFNFFKIDNLTWIIDLMTFRVIRIFIFYSHDVNFKFCWHQKLTKIQLDVITWPKACHLIGHCFMKRDEMRSCVTSLHSRNQVRNLSCLTLALAPCIKRVKN